MDISVVAIEVEDRSRSAVYGSSAIMINNKYILTTSNVIIPCIPPEQIEEILGTINSAQLHLISSLQDFDGSIRIAYKDLAHDKNHYCIRDAEIFSVFRNNHLRNATRELLKDWAIDSPENRYNYANLLSLFVVLKFKNSEATVEDFLDLAKNWLQAIEYETHNILDEVYVRSIPFGNKKMFNCYSRGIISNKIGRDTGLIFSDCPTTPGSEGGAVYKFYNKGSSNKGSMPIGIILSSCLWWRNEWTGLTLFADIRSIFSELLQHESRLQLANISHRRLLDIANSTLLQVYCETQWGTAIVISAEKGILITNSHVVEEDAAKITLHWKEFFCNARIVYKVPNDEIFDIAVLKCDPKFLLQHNLYSVQVGDVTYDLNSEVFAAGFALFPRDFKIGPSISKGYIIKKYDSMLITSTCINPGMSGGAILNRDGNLIGIIVCNTKIFDGNSVYPRFNMAIPYAFIKEIISNFIEKNDSAGLKKLWMQNYSGIGHWKNLEAKL